MTNLSKFLGVLFLTAFTSGFAQVKVDAELRSRLEYRHGYKTLIPKDVDAAVFVSQRTRLNIGYTADTYNFYVSLQDVRVWGDVPQLNKADKNGISLHQAWGELLVDSNFSVKFGRQEIVYDDSRIFGNVGWAQQARSHDAALLRYKRAAFKFDLGLAFNQDKERLIGTNLTTPKTYKAMQYLWLHNDWKDFSGSFLFLNNGLQTAKGLEYSQTVGTHLKSKQGKLNFVANAYYQFGTDKNNNNLSAYLVALEAGYKTSETSKVSLGVELQSGNDKGKPANNENKAFTPFYGTNHKFNGFMDYFYVGNHGNNVGLLDVYMKANFKVNNKSNLTVFVHNFSASADINSTVSKQLGTELDLVYGYKFSKDVVIKAGYSHLFASEAMEILKGNSDDNTNNWAWLMVTIKPTLFNAKK